jgi:RNA polymerase sigma-70 factor (ECF subfamily)
MKRAARESGKDDDSLTVHLVARSKTGDAEAMEFLIERYQPRVAGFVFACIGDGQVVDDVCQTVFLKMLRGLRRLNEDEKFESWLFRIARNACLDHLRRKRLRRIFVPWQKEADQFPSPVTPAEDRRIDNFRRALTMLPKKQRELVALLQDDQLSYEQLAAITNSSVSSVRARLFRTTSMDSDAGGGTRVSARGFFQTGRAASPE